MPQPPQSGSLEQILRCLRGLAQSPAFGVEMGIVTSFMGTQAWTPTNLVDANGLKFNLSLNDQQYGAPSTWVPNAWNQVLITAQIRPVPPYPLLMLLPGPGRRTFEFDTGQVAGMAYTVDAVAVAAADTPEVASRRALALIQGMERLVRRNEHLGGLVHLIHAEGPPAPGGEVEHARDGILSGVMQRFSVAALDEL